MASPSRQTPSQSCAGGIAASVTPGGQGTAAGLFAASAIYAGVAGLAGLGAMATAAPAAAPSAANYIYYNYAGGTLRATGTLATGWTPASGASATVINTIYGPIDNTGTANDFAGGLTVDTNANAVTLPATQPLTLQGDLSAQMVAGIDKFLMREIEQSVEAAAIKGVAFERTFERNAPGR